MSFNLLLITPETSHPKEQDIIIHLFENGLKTLHIRKPSFNKKQVQEYILHIPKKYHKRIVIHSHYSLLHSFPLKGIHLTEKTRKRKLPACYRSHKHKLSASFHSLQDIHQNKRKYDYIFLSPVFDSISKKNYKSYFDIDELGLFLKKHKNIIALGGIRSKNISAAQQRGFAGAAVLGYIWESKKPLVAFGKLQDELLK